MLLYDYGAAADPAGDVALAAAKLRSLGAGTVLLVGASEGAKASLVAATTLQPPPAGVVSLSAERMLRGSDVLPAAAKLRVPVLFVTARDDSLVGDATGQLYKAAAKAASRRLEVVAGSAHGAPSCSAGPPAPSSRTRSSASCAATAARPPPRPPGPARETR